VGIGGDEPAAAVFVGDAIVNRVEREQGVARKIHLGDQPLEKVEAEDRKMDMGRSPGVVMVAPGVSAWANGGEAVLAILIGQTAAGPAKVGVERRVVLIDPVEVAAAGVGLPNLDQGIGNRAIVFIQHAAGDDDPLANHLTVLHRVPG